jgi:tRNA threonylcarbamoyladenosine biosynthesis protein TsaE
MERVVITQGPEETEQVGLELAGRLRDGDVVALVGELGSGKTTLVKGIARGLFVREAVVSPSFVLARTYQGGRLLLHHLDAYRINSPAELDEVGLKELLPPGEGVTVVEWADKIAELIPPGSLWIRLEYLGPERRKLTLSRG